jgi:hypothetical protein
MATKKNKVETGLDEGTITIGSHSTRTEYANGKVLFVHDDEKLRQDVLTALEEFSLSEKKPAVKAKTVRNKKITK